MQPSRAENESSQSSPNSSAQSSSAQSSGAQIGDTTIDSALVKQHARSLGFHLVGVARIEEAPTEVERQSRVALETWLSQGYQADMEWMTSDRRKDIRQVMPGAKSIICVALNYYTGCERPEGREFAKISRYGWGRDYHRVLTAKLKRLVVWMKAQGTGVEAKLYADTGPVQDKFWAQQAGIGWIAKNGNVISRRYGSWIFLGEVITNLPLIADRSHTTHCGSCTRCLSACPTAAIRSPGVVDANRCIAYHTIENRADTLPDEIAQNLQGWVAGCDICQDVCPWNLRFAQETDVEGFAPYPHNVAPKLSELANIDEDDWNVRFPASALRRIKPPMLRRNARAAKAAYEQTHDMVSKPPDES